MTMKSRFWHLYNDNLRKRAELTDEMDWETVLCPANKGHQRGGKRLTDLSVRLPGKQVEDFVWTWGSGECLIQDRVLGFLRERQFTGFEVKPVKARFKRESVEPPPKLWELVI